MTNEIKSATDRPEGWERARLYFNDELVEGPIMLWRGQEHEIRIEIPETFMGTISLTKEDSRDLNIIASPEFGVPVNSVDKVFRWKITSVEDGKSDSIFLVFSSADVIVEWRYPCVVRSDYVGDDLFFRFGTNRPLPSHDLLLRRRVGLHLELVNKTGVELTAQNTNFIVQVYPPLIRGDVEYVLQGAAEEFTLYGNKNTGGKFDFIVEVVGVPKPLIVRGILLEEKLEDEGEIKVGGKAIPTDGIVFYRGRALSITFEPKPGSLIKEFPFWLSYTASEPLIEMESLPAFGEKQTGKYEWSAIGSKGSGTVALTLRGGNGDSSREDYIFKIPGKLLSRNLEDEVVVLINGKEPVGEMEFLHGVTYFLTLRLKEGSPLEGHALQLHCAGMEEFNPGDLVCEPGFDLPQTSNYGWLMTGKQGFGRFQLSLTGEGMDKALELPIFRLGGEDLSDFFEVWFDGKRLADGEKALATRYGRHTITLMPKSEAPEGKVKLGWGTTDPELGLEFTPSLGTAQTVDPINGATWSLACLGVDGEFSLKAELEGSPLPPLEIPVSLQPGSNNMRFTFLGIAQPYPPVMVTVNVPGSGTGWGVKPAVSVTTQEGEPVTGVKVEFITPDHPVGYGITGTNGSVGSSVTVRYYPEEERVVEFLAKTTEETGRVSMIRFLIKLVPAKPILKG